MNRTPPWRIVGFVLGFTVLLLLILTVSVTARVTTLAAYQLLCFALPALWHAMTVLGWDEEIRRAAPWLTAAALGLALLAARPG